jgi:photosystem II stability/assembly factor-like uncharacterized protein
LHFGINQQSTIINNRGKMMKQFFTFFLFLVFFGVSVFPQSYHWVLKQSGSSLGGPIDYSTTNTNIVYFGSINKVYKSIDRGDSFLQTGVNIPNSSDVKSIILDDANPGVFLVAVESSPNDKIYKTTDDGTTWTATLDEGQMSFFGIPMEQDPSNPNVIFTMTNTNFKKSTDFGDTWNTISSNFGPASAPCDIAVFPNTTTILIGDNGTGIFKSTDYGLTWTQTYVNGGGEIPTISVDFTHPGIAWATKWSGGGGLLKSTDYGSTWTLQPTFSGISMWGVHVQPTDGNVVIANSYSTSPGSWRTVDGGLTWTPINIPSPGYQVVSVDSITEYAAQGAGFYKLDAPWFVPVELTSFTGSLNNNAVVLNWSTASELNNQGFEIEKSLNNIDFQKIGYVPGFGTTTEIKSYSFKITEVPSVVQYYRLKQIDFDGTFTYTSSVEVEGVSPKDFQLQQNHPNPFNPSTQISFTLPVESNVSIKLFNLLGQEVTNILTSQMQAGSHEVNFNAGSLSSGTYIYVLEAEGLNGRSFRESKKMMLMK